MKLTGKAKAAFLKRMEAGRRAAKRKRRTTTTTANPRTRQGKKRRRNSSDETGAAEMYESFHGAPATRLTVHEVGDEYTEHVAELGKLIQLQVITDPATNDTITEIDDFGHCRVCCSPDGGQLYFVGGNQTIDLHELGLDHQLPKDHVEVGQLARIVYHTKKGFHDFEPIDYYHDLGEDRDGRMPTLHYDTHNQRLFLTGGTYQCRPEGIVN